MDLRASLEEAVYSYASKDFVKVSPEDSVIDVAKLMQRASATEAVAVSDGLPIGIITERDVVYKVVAAGLDPRSTRVREVMSAPIETVEETTKVGEAIHRMTMLGVRRLGVTKKGKIVGLVTQRILVGGGAQKQVLLPELATPGALGCPYCGESMRDTKELSKHIDRVHLGLGLLEGNVSKW